MPPVKHIVPPPGKSESYYIGWFKHSVPGSDSQRARQMAQEFMRTGRYPRVPSKEARP